MTKIETLTNNQVRISLTTMGATIGTLPTITAQWNQCTTQTELWYWRLKFHTLQVFGWFYCWSNIWIHLLASLVGIESSFVWYSTVQFFFHPFPGFPIRFFGRGGWKFDPLDGCCKISWNVMRSHRPRRTPRSWRWWRQGMNTKKDVQQREKVSQVNVVGV